MLARVLDHHRLDRVGPRFFRQAKRITGVAWSMAIGADLGHPGVEGPRTATWRLLNAYIRRVFGVAHRDPVVAEAALKVIAMVNPPQHLMRPRIASRVLSGATRPPVTESPPSAHVRSYRFSRPRDVVAATGTLRTQRARRSHA